MAALNGILAARLAAAGASGPASVFEGAKGLYAALSARPADPGSILADLGTRWETAAIGIKPYPACQLLHSTLDAAAAVVPRVRSADQVVRVIADVHPDSAAIVCEPWPAKLAPRTPYDAKFSLPWSVAALLHDGSVDLATYSEASIARPAVAELASRVEIRLTGDHGPAADAAGRVELHLSDGRSLTGQIPGSLGTTGAPLPSSDIVAKFAANCGGGGAASELAQMVLALADAPSLHGVFELSRRIVQEQTA